MSRAANPADVAASFSADELRDVGFWAMCQAEPLIDVLLRGPDLPNEDLLKTLLVRLQQLVGVAAAALEPDDPNRRDIDDLLLTVYGNMRDAS